MAPQPHSPRTQSPLTRGKHPAWILRVIASRLIPAHAGKTMSETMITVPSWAHPRSRGENGAPGDEADVEKGSSPLTRGKPPPGQRRPHGRGLIPAHAGKTCRDPSRRPIHRAHPRSRGENAIARGARKRCGGSSPLTRGKRVNPRETRASGRLIPAHAGKTWVACAYDRGTSAHPRSRGENLINAHMRRCDHGSSPLTRGKLADQGLSLDGLGLIPAHAGKTNRGRQGSLLAGAHPRSRGENV